jgi:nucleoside-diphosphate-sugar epimerase
LHVDDLFNACLYLTEHYNEEGLINVGIGENISIAGLAQLVRCGPWGDMSLTQTNLMVLQEIDGC